MRREWRQFREALALAIAPWLERPESISTCDFRDGGPMVETAAIAGGQQFVRELLARGLPVADRVTVFYYGLEGEAGGFRVVSIDRDEPGIRRRGKLRLGDETEPVPGGP